MAVHVSPMRRKSLAIVVLGMRRSGTESPSPVMLAAGGLASAGDSLRNWDNTRGHHEMFDVVLGGWAGFRPVVGQARNRTACHQP